MKCLLARAHQDVLVRLSWSNVLLGFDFDGTLAPLVARPDRAALRPSTRRLMRRVAELYPCVVISGRGVSDVGRRLEGIPLRAIVGNHGLEPLRATDGVRRKVQRWKARLAPRIAEFQGVEIEDKTYSLALHFRRSRRKTETLRGIGRVLRDLREVRTIGGKQVVNVVPADAPHKGAALEHVRDRLGCDSALFLGDDVTDEDVFALEHPGLVGVRVGAARHSQASYCVTRQRDVDVLLERLIELRNETNETRRRRRPTESRGRLRHR